MIKYNKVYFDYEGYENRFGNVRRPALVRHSTKFVGDFRYGEIEEIDVVTLYVDGKTYENTLGKDSEPYLKPYSLVLFEPNHSNQKDVADYHMVARPFNPESKDDWNCLFYDTSQLHQMGDRLAYAAIAIALDRYSFKTSVILDALNFLQEPARGQVIDLIKYVSYGLSKEKITQINELNRSLGRPSDSFFPVVLEDAARQYGLAYNGLNVHSLVDRLFEKSEEKTIKEPKGFTLFVQWLKDESAIITLQDLDTYFAFLGEDIRSLAIKRYFYDVKKGVFKYDGQSLKAFSSQNYQYYSSQRYIYEWWPGNRNVSTDFFLDCLKTYEKTNQQYFQVSDGILDWAIQKAIEVNRPIEMKFYDWLSYCQGGIIINKSFKGFADFDIKYELDDFAFEEESLRKSIHSIVRQHCERLSHLESVIRTDPKTGEPLRDPQTNAIETTQVRIYEKRWRLSKDGDKKHIDLFVNWDKKPETEPENDVFIPEMVDYSIVRDRVEAYLNEKYGSLTPYVSERHPDDIVKMFAYEIGMRATIDNSISMGENPGVEESVVKQRITERMSELFGDSLDCEYNQATYRRALSDSLYRSTGKSTECFERKIKKYYREREIYCAPELSELPNLLTGRKCAICQGDMCFVTSIKKEPDWKEYTMIHILEIIGYKVLEETDAGYMPNAVYNQFVTQINKAIRFSKRLICKDCGHILFPARQRGHSRFKCLLPSCPEYNKEVYLNYCHDCKKVIIDSRDTKQCPNGLYICPSCNSCCSNAFFEKMAERYRVQGLPVPAFVSRNMGKGHRDRNMFFCSKCGTQKVDYINNTGNHEWRCLECNPIREGEYPICDEMEDYPPLEEGGIQPEVWE